MNPIQLVCTVERKAASLPRFVVVPSAAVSEWKLGGTTIVEVELDGVPIGRRSLKAWGRSRDAFFLDLTDAHCRAAGLDTGDRCELTLSRASERLPEELQKLLDISAEAREAWRSRTPSQRRQLREHVLAAKKSATRERRARKALLG